MTATTSAVRLWASENGLDAGGSRGRLPQATINEFNKVHRTPQTRYTGSTPRVIEVKVKPEKGRTIVRKVVLADVRAAASAAGVKVGKRGRIPNDVMNSFVLGKFSPENE